MSDLKPSTTDTDSLDLNWEHLHEISGNDSEFELELLQMFVEDAQIHVEATKEAIANKDFRKLEQETHHLKGASANVGAAPMQLAAQKLEQQFHQQKIEGASDLISQLEEFIDRIQSFLAKQ